jgi:D-glycero-D-manno-heptose 1,7-bisphosphate phosphatase
VTNQRWLFDPAADLTRYGQVHTRLNELLAADDAHLEAAYYCPHARGSCSRRKTKPGLLQRTAKEHRLSLNAAVMIDDSETDVEVGRAAGTATILFAPTSGSPPVKLISSSMTGPKLSVSSSVTARGTPRPHVR